MGGGYSSVSKIMVISPSTRKDVDIDYLFGQVDIKTATVVRFKNILHHIYTSILLHYI
jgi:2-methylaconitate cis-trans-isomerase PrpF